MSYEDLLGEFFTMHDPSRPSHSTQYASLVLYSGDAQRDAAKAAAVAFEPRFGRPVLTRIAPLTTFFLAEDHHQKYALRSDGALNAEVHERHPDEAAFRDSMLAARLNGFAYGMGSTTLLDDEIASFDLSAAGTEHLRALVR